MTTDTLPSESTELLARPPIFDSVDPRRLVLIKAQIAPKCNDAEVAHFLELCAHYELDPFAHEAWCAKGKNGNLLIMVGRDGLRKIAQRNGLHVDGDVVRAKDEITIVRTPDGNRTVAHAYGNPSQRGEIIGAWAECREGGPMGRPMGYFYAPLAEYQPKVPNEYSPWAKQVGVMILAAAERQAIRQATPLGGLLAVGEDEVVNERALAAGDDPAVEVAPEDVPWPDGPLGERLRAAVDAANEIEANAYTPATLAMLLAGQTPAELEAIAAKIEDDNLEAAPPDAEVVDGPTDAVSPSDVPVDVDALRSRLTGLLDHLASFDDPGDPHAQEVSDEITHVEECLRAAGAEVPGQEAMEL